MKFYFISFIVIVIPSLYIYAGSANYITAKTVDCKKVKCFESTTYRDLGLNFKLHMDCVEQIVNVDLTSIGIDSTILVKVIYSIADKGFRAKDFSIMAHGQWEKRITISGKTIIYRDKPRSRYLSSNNTLLFRIYIGRKNSFGVAVRCDYSPLLKNN